LYTFHEIRSEIKRKSKGSIAEQFNFSLTFLHVFLDEISDKVLKNLENEYNIKKQKKVPNYCFKVFATFLFNFLGVKGAEVPLRKVGDG